MRPSLATLASRRSLVGLEIGVGQAINSLNILNGLDVELLYLIDIHLPSTNLGKQVADDQRVKFMHGDSLAMIDLISTPLDFACIDGCYEYLYDGC